MLAAWYINLDAATARREALQANFARHAPGVPLTRVPAVDVDEVRAEGVKGQIREAEKAAFLSHRKAIEASLASPHAALILEDDAELGPVTMQILNGVVSGYGAQMDLLYAEACITGAADLINLYGFRKHLARQNRVELMDLRPLTFAGAVAYVVMPHAKQKVLARLNAFAELNQPVDLLLRDSIQSGLLKASVTFPFVVGQSVLSAESQLREGGEETLQELAWTAVRRMMNLGFDLERDDATAAIRALPPETYDPAARQFADIVRLYLSDRFLDEW